MIGRLVGALILFTLSVMARPGAQTLTLPNAPESVKFAVIGDNGTGQTEQYDVAREMAASHAMFAFDLVIMLGDNMYGRQGPADFVQKFEKPYQPLLDAGVRFFASLGNHDHPTNRFYKPFNMDGERYYSYVRKNVRFFVLDSNRMDQEQLAWLAGALKESSDEWKICYFHHPLYSDGKRHGSQEDLRAALEPIFTRYEVNVVFSGHDHLYERIQPQHGISYFVSGAGGELRKGGLKRSAMTAAGFDQDRSFMLVEIQGSEMAFEAISRTGAIVDSGVIRRQTPGR